jgi:hypothetical protein
MLVTQMAHRGAPAFHTLLWLAIHNFTMRRTIEHHGVDVAIMLSVYWNKEVEVTWHGPI